MALSALFNIGSREKVRTVNDRSNLDDPSRLTLNGGRALSPQSPPKTVPERATGSPRTRAPILHFARGDHDRDRAAEDSIDHGESIVSARFTGGLDASPQQPRTHQPFIATWVQLARESRRMKLRFRFLYCSRSARSENSAHARAMASSCRFSRWYALATNSRSRESVRSGNALSPFSGHSSAQSCLPASRYVSAICRKP